MWLIELIEYNIAAGESEQNNLKNNEDFSLNDPVASTAAFYNYLWKTYTAFLSGKDDLYAQLEEQFVSTFQNADLLVRDEIECVVKKNTSLIVEIQDLKSRSAYLLELMNKHRELRATQSAIETIIVDQHRQLEAKRVKVAALDTDFDALSDAVEEIESRNTLARLTIISQEVSPKDIENMQTEKAAHTQAKATRQALQLRIKHLEQTLRNEVVALEETIRKYHSTAANLKLVPQSAQNARGENLSIVVDICAKRPEMFLQSDVRGVILPVMQDLQLELSELKLRCESQAEQATCEEMRQMSDELQDELAACESKINRLEAEYKREKESVDLTLAAKRVQIETLEHRLLTNRDNVAEEARIARSTRRMAEIASIRAARRTEHMRKKRAMLERIESVVTQCVEVKESVTSKLETLHEQYSTRLLSLLHGVSTGEKVFNTSSSTTDAIHKSMHSEHLVEDTFNGGGTNRDDDGQFSTDKSPFGAPRISQQQTHREFDAEAVTSEDPLARSTQCAA
eukprot:gene35673-43990_t